MSKWKVKLDQILKKEREEHKGVYDLYKKIKDHLHGNTDLNIEKTKEDVLTICQFHKLNNSSITNVEIFYSRTNSDPQYLTIEIQIDGMFKGKIHMETSAGTKGNDRTPIYYVADYNCCVVSEKEQKIKDYYINFKHRNAEKFIDIALDRDLYLQFRSDYRTYTIWDKEPHRYDDSIQGNDRTYKERENYTSYYNSHLNIKKIEKTESISKFAYENLYGSKQSVEWHDYQL